MSSASLLEEEADDGASQNGVAEALERKLQDLNIEYRDKRSSGRLAPLRIIMVAPGTWERMRERKLSQSHCTLEQYKHPCLITDMEFAEKLANGVKDDNSG